MAFCSNVISGSVSDLKTDSPTATALEALTFWIASGMRLPGGFLAPKVCDDVDWTAFQSPTIGYDIMNFGRDAAKALVALNSEP